MALKVAVDGWGLSRGAAYRGVGTYTRQILGGLARTSDLDVVAFAERGAELPPGVGRASIVRLPEHRYSQVEHEMLLPFDLRRRGVDVVFEPAPDAPWHPPGALVQTLHDTIPLVRDDPDIAWARRRWRRYVPRYRHARAVIAISRYTADEGIRVLGLDPRRVHVIHHGVDRTVFHPGAPPAPSDRPYVVMVNEYSQRKGFDAAFAAIAGIADRGQPHQLRVAGRIMPWIRDELEALVAAAPQPERVELLGFVDDLAGLYRGASVAVVTSRHEGFGFPALEAMACGIPLVAWANTATTEVVADGGVLVPDGDLTGLVDELVRVLTDEGYAAELRERGLGACVDRFTWEASIAEHAEVIRSAAN